MKKTAIILSVLAFFAGGCRQSNTKDPGVVINGVKWATRNVDVPGKFAVSPEVTGKFYQWNRKIAWETIGDVTDWDDTVPVGSSWLKSNDPSPFGWRVPTIEELDTLLDTDNVTSEWTTVKGVNGRKFTDKTSGKSLFLPAVGSRYYSDGMLVGVGTYGNYWISTALESNETNAYFLSFYSDGAGSNNGYLSRGFSVRAVVE